MGKLIKKHLAGSNILNLHDEKPTAMDNTFILKPDYNITPIAAFDKNIGQRNPNYDLRDDTYGIVGLPNVNVYPNYKSEKDKQRALNMAEGNRGKKYMQEAIDKYAFPVGAAIMGGATAASMGGAGLLSTNMTPLDVAFIANDPSNPVNYMPAVFSGRNLISKGISKGNKIRTSFNRGIKKMNNRVNDPIFDTTLRDYKSDFVDAMRFRFGKRMENSGINFWIREKDHNAIKKINERYKSKVRNNRINPRIFDEYLEYKGITNNSEYEQLTKIFNEDPRYFDFVIANRELDPLNPETVSKFIKKQSTSIRGVNVNLEDEDKIEEYLTTDSFHPNGGDRLSTDKYGVYHSNDDAIAERFSNPKGDKESIGAIAKLVYDFGDDVTLPIRERLANVRRKIFPYDVVDAYEGINITDRLRSGYPITESQYSTRNGQILPGFERTARTEETNLKIFDIEDLKKYKRYKDEHGRWARDITNGDLALQNTLFEGNNIGNSFGDYLKFMRTVEKYLPETEIKNPEFLKLIEEFNNTSLPILENQFDLKTNLVNLIRNNSLYKGYYNMTSLINTLKYYSPKTTTTMHLLPKTAVGTYAGLGAANYITEEIKRSKRKNEKLWAKRENNETNEE